MYTRILPHLQATKHPHLFATVVFFFFFVCACMNPPLSLMIGNKKAWNSEDMRRANPFLAPHLFPCKVCLVSTIYNARGAHLCNVGLALTNSHVIHGHAKVDPLLAWANAVEHNDMH